MSVRFTLRRGDLQRATAGALITSANDSLVGNLQPMYWRFISRQSVDGMIRKATGPELEAGCVNDFEPIPSERSGALRRDITRWTSGVKHGDSEPVRCPAGSAVSTRAFGKLQADHVIHAVAPDSEFGYEGMYTGGLLDQRISGAVAGNDTPTSFAGGAANGLASQHFTPPDLLLLQTYESALAEASRLRVSSVALCGLGCGVKGWKPAISATLCLEALSRIQQQQQQQQLNGADALSSVEVALGGSGQLAVESWRNWLRATHELLGGPPGLESAAEMMREADAAGEMTWVLEPRALPADSDTDSHPPHEPLLDFSLVKEFKEMWKFRAQGKNGRDDPLTPEQELQAARRRSTR